MSIVFSAPLTVNVICIVPPLSGRAGHLGRGRQASAHVYVHHVALVVRGATNVGARLGRFGRESSRFRPGVRAGRGTDERRFRRFGPYAGLAFWLYLTRDWVTEQP